MHKSTCLEQGIHSLALMRAMASTLIHHQSPLVNVVPRAPLLNSRIRKTITSSFSLAAIKGSGLSRRRDIENRSDFSVKAASIQESFTRLEEGREVIGNLGIDPPKGLHRYETMVVLRSDIIEAERLDLSQRYEETIVAGGGMNVEIFNRGIMPLAYVIKTKNMAGITTNHLDGIYFLFTYMTKPEGIIALKKKLNADDDVIRSSTFRIKKEKLRA